jgi:hypothetical protein
MTSLCLQQDLNTWFTKGFLDADFTIAASLRSSADLQIGPVPLRITMPGNGCMNGVKADGTPMPFGARVENEQGTLLAIADPSGQALVMVESDKGVLKVKSGALVCEAGYVLPERANVQGYDQVRLVCR